ncbi:hypothetical protein TRFO_39237 [Tritrichomonas foetus]|uniref:ENTH domain-containing protein n=1 Tax=Tritrichomonas foetus TaxID=1144522 RepID=A0A1J4J5P2_9EUKA|nr:hypothetical protein TRFO_39237 [Tritrichomonas foetus]|eukprot:OHS94568.1 hypothetical protein TRFO_39237 [Tritrichomonas foetus]
MASVLKWTKEKARKTEYMFKNKDDVQKRVLEATRDDDEQITDGEYLTVAKLTYNSAALTSIRKTLWKRFIRIQKAPVCCRKALQILDYCLRYGSPQVRQMILSGSGELQTVSNSHHFTSHKPREYMNEEQSRNLVQNLLALANNQAQYEEVRKNSESTLDRVKNHYVQPLEVKMKGSSAPYSAASPSMYSSNTSSSYNNPYKDEDSSSNKSGSGKHAQSASKSHPQQTTQAASAQIQYTSSDDEELEFDPREKSNQQQNKQLNSGNTGGGFQQQQQGFNMFNQQPQQQNSNPFQQQQQQQNSNPFQQQQQMQPKPQASPFQQPQQQPNSNPFQQQQSNPFQQQQQQQNVFGGYPQQQNAFGQQNAGYGQNNFGGQPAFPQQNYSQQNLQHQQYNFFQQQQQPPSADELLFGPSPTQQRQQPMQAPMQAQPDPNFDGILDFSNIPMQPMSQQPNQQSQNPGGGMFDEFGDLVDLDLQKRPQRAHGRPDTMERGYNQPITRPY